jgi:hypothetical protein
MTSKSESLLADLEHQFDNGDRHALIRAIGACVLESKSLPDWIQWELTQAYFRFEMGKLDSWDDVFGKPFPGKSRQRTLKETRAFEVWRRVNEHENPIPGAFEDVAAELSNEGRGVGGASTVRDLYYFMQNGGWREES